MAVELLGAENYQDEEWTSSALNWGCRYVREQARDLRAHCGDGSAIAASFGGRIELYLSLLLEKTSPGRAETLMHESRHEGGKPHDRELSQLVSISGRRERRRLDLGL